MKKVIKKVMNYLGKLNPIYSCPSGMIPIINR